MAPEEVRQADITTQMSRTKNGSRLRVRMDLCPTSVTLPWKADRHAISESSHVVQPPLNGQREE